MQMQMQMWSHGNMVSLQVSLDWIDWIAIQLWFGKLSVMWCICERVKEKSKKEVFNSCNAWNLETSEKVNMETELGKLPDHRKWGKPIWVSNMYCKIN